jgi:hypothetical protein
VFSVFGEFAGSSYREASYLCEVLLVVSFPTKLVSSHSKFPCKNYLSFIVPGKRLISAVKPALSVSRPNRPVLGRIFRRATDHYLEQQIGRRPNGSAPGRIIRPAVRSCRTWRRTIRPGVRRRRTYGRIAFRASSSGYIFTHL